MIKVLLTERRRQPCTLQRLIVETKASWWSTFLADQSCSVLRRKKKPQQSTLVSSDSQCYCLRCILPSCLLTPNGFGLRLDREEGKRQIQYCCPITAQPTAAVDPDKTDLLVEGNDARIESERVDTIILRTITASSTASNAQHVLINLRFHFVHHNKRICDPCDPYMLSRRLS